MRLQASILARSTQLSAQHREYVPPVSIGVRLQIVRCVCKSRHYCPLCALPAEQVVSRYLAKHPALTELMHDFLTNVLVNKPDDCYQFCQVRVWVSVCA